MVVEEASDGPTVLRNGPLLGSFGYMRNLSAQNELSGWGSSAEPAFQMSLFNAPARDGSPRNEPSGIVHSPSLKSPPTVNLGIIPTTRSRVTSAKIDWSVGSSPSILDSDSSCRNSKAALAMLRTRDRSSGLLKTSNTVQKTAVTEFAVDLLVIYVSAETEVPRIYLRKQ